MMNAKAFLLGIMLTLALPAMAERFVSCHDGDTCTLESGLHVRFAGIDAPEIGQPFAEASRDYMTRMVVGRESTLQCTGWSYKRRVCDVFVNDMDVQKELVGWGLAYDYVKYSNGKYQNAQVFAQKMHRGVWTLQDGGVLPWNYRHSKPFQSIYNKQ
jgi:endonuclease YncB( thermonuclease family)